MEKSKKRRKREKKTNKKPEDKLKGEHEPDEEAQKQRAVVRQESGGLEENEIHAHYVKFNKDSTDILTS